MFLQIAKLDEEEDEMDTSEGKAHSLSQMSLPFINLYILLYLRHLMLLVVVIKKMKRCVLCYAIVLCMK